MDKAHEIKISINSQTFKTYDTLVKYINENLQKHICGNKITLKNETIKLLTTIKALLVKGQHCEIYPSIMDYKLHDTLIAMMELYVANHDAELLRALLSLVITITDNSETLCAEFSANKMPSILVDQTIEICEKKFPLPKSIKIEEIVAQLILIVHNISRHTKFQQSFFELTNISSFKENLLQFLGSRDKRMLILTMSVLTWLALDGNRDKFILNNHLNIIDQFLDFINKGVKDKGHWYEGLNVWELLSVLQTLTAMEAIEREAFFTKSFISTIISILNSKTSLPEEIDICFSIILNLTFNEKFQRKLILEFPINEALKFCVHRDNKFVRGKALDVMWYLSSQQTTMQTMSNEQTTMQTMSNQQTTMQTMSNQQTTMQTMSNQQTTMQTMSNQQTTMQTMSNQQTTMQTMDKTNTKFDVFISYCHAQSDVVLPLVTELKKKYNVWIDTDGIRGLGMEDMANGIEQSRLLIMAVSNSYRQSPYCKLEAFWAQRLHKPIIPLIMEYKYKPTGWLGMMISSDSYIDVKAYKSPCKLAEIISEHWNHKCSCKKKCD